MPDFITLSCPSCGSAVFETDIDCRKCGVCLFSDGNEKLIRRGRNIVIIVAISEWSIEILGYIADTSVMVSYIIRTADPGSHTLFHLPRILLCKVAPWNRWNRGVRLAGIGEIISFYYFGSFTLAIVETALTASTAGLLLFFEACALFQNVKELEGEGKYFWTVEYLLYIGYFGRNAIYLAQLLYHTYHMEIDYAL